MRCYKTEASKAAGRHIRRHRENLQARALRKIGLEMTMARAVDVACWLDHTMLRVWMTYLNESLTLGGAVDTDCMRHRSEDGGPRAKFAQDKEEEHLVRDDCTIAQDAEG